MSSDSQFVFVYGTLRSGASNAFRMEGAQLVSEGFVRGRLYRVDWYPGIVLDDEADWVRGEIWMLDSGQITSLDEFEGEEYRRIPGQVQPATADGDVNQSPQKSLPVWIWEWRGAVDKLESIPTGDWLDVETTRSKET